VTRFTSRPRMLRRWTASVACPVVALLAGGCAAGMDANRATTRVVEGADVAEVLDVAQRVLQREFGRVRVDRTSGRISTDPVEFRTVSESGTPRDLVRAPSTMRRTGVLTAARSQNGALVRLRIDVERQDTQRRETLPPEHPQGQRLSDSPAHTPIDRDAATTGGQNTAWTIVRRDTALERSLLDEVLEWFAREGEVAEPDAAPATAQPAAAPAAAQPTAEPPR
jgi:hypothetical protein